MSEKLIKCTAKRTGGDLAVVLNKRGCVQYRTTSNNRTWVCGLPGTEHITVNCGVKSWKRQRSCRGTLPDDDDDEEEDCKNYAVS